MLKNRGHSIACPCSSYIALLVCHQGMHVHHVTVAPFTCTAICRSDHWWSYIVQQTFTQSDWIENFRMSHQTFTYLCQQLAPVIEHQNTRMRKAIAVKQRVAVTLWCLATSVEYRTIGHLFGIARCTVCQIVHETCLAIVKVLLNKYISFPTGERLRKVTEGFEKSWGLPQCAGAVDGSHIPIAAPTTNHTDYYNRKGYYSIIIQALVDY